MIALVKVGSVVFRGCCCGTIQSTIWVPLSHHSVVEEFERVAVRVYDARLGLKSETLAGTLLPIVETRFPLSDAKGAVM